MRFSVLGALVAPALLVSSSLASPLGPKAYYELWVQADSLFENREFAAALPLYEQLRAAAPEEGSILYRLAISRYASGDSEGAIPTMAEALDLGFGRENRICHEIARILTRAGRGEEALPWLERALAARLEDRPDLKTDEALEPLRSDPRFRELAGFAPAGKPSREEGWAFDLAFFLAEVRRLHAAPSRYGQSEEFAAAVAGLEARVSELTDDEVALELQKLIVTLGDGHSVLYPIPTPKVSFAALPLKFHFFSDGVYVIDATEDHADLINLEVTAIGGRSLQDVTDRLRPYISRDNDQGLSWFGPHYLRLLSILRDLGYTDSPTMARLTVRDVDGSTRETEVAATASHFPFKINPYKGRTAENRPLWLRNMDDNFWYAPMPELGALYFQFNQVRHKDDQTIGDFAEDLKRELERGGVRNLIIDVRHNNGGNNTLLSPLIRVLVYFEVLHPDNRIFVITGRNTFSACQNFINRVERHTDAVFVGEPSSSKPNFTGEDTSVELPYSGLHMSISSRYWQDSDPGDRRPWIPVSVPVGYSWTDFSSGRDPALAVLLKILSPR